MGGTPSPSSTTIPHSTFLVRRWEQSGITDRRLVLSRCGERAGKYPRRMVISCRSSSEHQQQQEQYEV